MRFLLKNSNLAPVFVSDVLVDGEDEHEDEEEASTAEEVPEVVSEVRNLYLRTTILNVKSICSVRQGGIKCGKRGTGFLDSEGSHR